MTTKKSIEFSLPKINSSYINDWLKTLNISSSHVWDRFGKNYCNGIDGWIFSDQEIRQAAKNNQLMHMDYEFGQICSLKCFYCFREEDNRDGIKGKDYPMTFSQWENVLDQACDLGLKSIKLLGQGELTESRNFFQALEAIHKRGITPLLFTAAHVIGNDRQCKHLHGIEGEDFCKKLYDLGASVMVKVNSFDPQEQDRIVGHTGYTEKRNLGLKRLLESNFAEHNPTRLGLEVAMMNTDKDELEDIYNLKFHLNVYIDLDPFMPCGLTKDPDSLSFELSYEDKIDMYRRVYSNNINYGVPFRGISPYAGGQVCSQLGFGLYVNLYGKVFPCPGSHEELGDISQSSLKDIFLTNPARKTYQNKLDHGCPFREESGILKLGWENEVRGKISHLINYPNLFKLSLEE